eukprot:4709664-Prymnesium_polylepis.1
MATDLTWASNTLLLATAVLAIRNAARCGPQPRIEAGPAQACESDPLAFLWPRGCRVAVDL